MPSASRISTIAIAAGLVVAPMPLASAGPEKPPLQESAASLAEGRSAANLLVTFRDRPDRATAAARLAAIGGVAPIVPEIGVWQLRPRSPSNAVRRAKRAQGVAAVEAARVRQTTQLVRPKRPFTLTEGPSVDDPLYNQAQQWGLFRTGWSSALISRPRPPIALLDAGLDITHPEWAQQPAPIRRPLSVFKASSDVRDWYIGHGTHVAGIAAAPANGLGIVGVAPAEKGKAEIIPVQIADRRGVSTDTRLIKGIRHAVRAGARVINISAGGPVSSRALGDTILWATHRGALVVAAVGNEGLGFNTLNFPAAYPRVLGVGAQCDGSRSLDCPKPFGVARFSNRNESVDVIAPGVGVVSSVPLGVRDGAVAPGYATKDGSSMAAPFVSAVAALVMANNPNRLSSYQVRKHLEDTARDLPPSGRDDASGHGVVNPNGAVTLPGPPDDLDEVNDDVKFVARRKGILEKKPNAPIEAFIDAVEDEDDVYPIRLKRGDRVRFTLRHGRGLSSGLILWAPTTRTIRETGPANFRKNLIESSTGRESRTKVIEVDVPRTGRYYVNVFARSGAAKYDLSVERGLPSPSAPTGEPPSQENETL